MEDVVVNQPRPPSSGIALMTIAALGAAIGATVVIATLLERIPNGPEAVDEYIPMLNAFLVASGVVLVWSLVMAMKSGFKPAHRAAKFTAIVCVVSFFLWYAPTPFGVHRYLLEALILIGAAFLVLAGLRAAWADFKGRESGPKWVGGVLATGALSSASATLLLIKIGMIWWQVAVD